MTGALGQRRLLVAVTLAVAAFVLFFPARQLVGQRQRIDALEERRAALRAENARLADDVARLSDPDEVEALARDRLGLIRPGERAYYVDAEGEPASTPATTASSPSFWGRIWTWLGSVVRGRT